MATDTAHIDLELASGRNEVTAPFHQTAQRRRKQPQDQPAEDAADRPPDTRVVVDVPVDASVDESEASRIYPGDPELIERPGIGQPNWMALIGVTVAVAVAVWWVMSQRLPDIDPREVIERNLSNARGAMAEGRYTDPSERSAFHYYSTVLALDPDNTDAIAGIDAIADRHLTDARLLLAERRIAEAGVAIERARRVRPDHTSLPDLDLQLRAELRKILAAGAVPKLPAETVKAKVAKVANAGPARSSPAPRNTDVARSATPPPSGPAVLTTNNRPPAIKVSSIPALALAPAEMKQTSLITPAAAEDLAASGSAPLVDESVNAAAPSSLPESSPAPAEVVAAVAPNLVKMVQPEYPTEAAMRGIEGWVDVSMQVNAAGDVVAPRIEDSSRGRLFNRAALTAVQQWKYEPRTGDTSERVRVRLQFRQSR